MNSNFHKFQTAILIIVLGMLFSAAAFGQEDAEPVDRSVLVGVSLPKGALRMFDDQVPEEVSRTMNKIVAEGGGKLRQGETEVLVWAGSDLKKAGSKSITEHLATTLKA